MLTLPLIRLLAISNASEREEITGVFQAAGEAGKLRSLLDKIREAKTIEYALSKARDFNAQAREELKNFPVSPVKQSLHKLLDYVLERNK